MRPPVDVAHLVVTENFAGTERYVCTVANATAARGLRVAVVGGAPERMRTELDPAVRHLPGPGLAGAARSLAGLGRVRVCHAHLTAAETVAVALRRVHRGRIVSTRHIAGHRGGSVAGGLVAGWVGRHLHSQIAISDFVAAGLERRPDTVIRNAVPDAPLRWRAQNRSVLLMQRLEPEKDTLTALRGWQASGLSEAGWRLTVLGDGSQRAYLRNWADRQGVDAVHWVGRTADVTPYLDEAGMMLASAPAEPLGLSVLEAMAAGIPVVAALGGGHLETVPAAQRAYGFEPADAQALAAALARLAQEESTRRELSELVRGHQRTVFGLDAMIDRLLEVYAVPRVRA